MAQIFATNDYVVTYEQCTNVLVNLNSGIRMLEEGFTEEGLAAIKRAKEQLRDYRGMNQRATEVTDAYIRYLNHNYLATALKAASEI